MCAYPRFVGEHYHIGHREQINSTIYQSAVPKRIPVYRQEVKTCHIALISGIKIGSALNAVKGTVAIILSSISS
uniref:Uncharacterized protein n=1 Tax=Timema douglasi TaxID=61478 RepID=A0A7R8ZDA8_TIMDO|nr:unnamed protein product [Timema douglasi]